MKLHASTACLIVGGGLLTASLGQYGYMAVRQTELRHEFEATPLHHAPAASADRTMRIVIPSIDLSDAVVPGTSYADLLAGPGWITSTPAPGEPGNSAIAGHRDTFFRHVADLHRGDTLEVDRAGRRYGFVVQRREIVYPTDVAVLAPTPSPTLTLITCYPTYWIGPAPKRLIVQANLAWVR